MQQLIKLVRTLPELQELVEYFLDKDLIAYDTETTGLNKDSEIVGYSICADPTLGWYVILSAWDNQEQKLIKSEACLEAVEFLKTLPGKSLVMHNATYDCAVTEANFKISLIDSVKVDTMLLAHLNDENRSVGLKELGISIFGQDAAKEQQEMKASVIANGGIWSDAQGGNKEMYKADSDILGRYGAKDAILTLNILYEEMPRLLEQDLDAFFFEETMPLLRGPTYELNTVGIKVDAERLQKLRQELETEVLELKSFIYKEINSLVKDKYPGTAKAKTFNINAGQQLSWLLYECLGELFSTLTDTGRDVCDALGMKLPYSDAAKRQFVRSVKDSKGIIWRQAKVNPKTGKLGKPAKVGDLWAYTCADEEALQKFTGKYKWVEALLKYKKSCKLLSTYVLGIQDKVRYGVIHPSFLQHGTTSGRYSSKAPNFQNLPKNDKRVKACMVPRPGNVFVGADHSQLEPRVFASVSKDPTLCGCFARGEDFYSVVGVPIYGVTGCSLFKNEENSFAKLYEDLRENSKIFSLSTPYGRTAAYQAAEMGISIDEAKDLIERYFSTYPNVELMMLNYHSIVKRDGVVYSLFGRPRRIPDAKNIEKSYGTLPHSKLPYVARNLLNLAMNHPVQSSAASIVNRGAIAFYSGVRTKAKNDPRWAQVKLILQVHDSLVAECPKDLSREVSALMKDCLENTVELPLVKLEAIPKIGTDLSQV